MANFVETQQYESSAESDDEIEMDQKDKKVCKPFPAAKDVPLGEKRKRGRSRKATKALLID